MRMIASFAAAALALASCGGGGNAGSPGNATNVTPSPNTAATVREEPPALALDQERLVETCIPRAERERPIAALGAPRRAALNLCLNQETVRQLTPRLPVRIDSNTRLDRVGVEGAALVYRYRITKAVAELPAGTPDRLEAMTRQSACAGEDVRQILALGGVQVYRWVDRDEAPIREVRISAC